MIRFVELLCEDAAEDSSGTLLTLVMDLVKVTHKALLTVNESDAHEMAVAASGILEIAAGCLERIDDGHDRLAQAMKRGMWRKDEVRT